MPKHVCSIALIVVLYAAVGLLVSEAPASHLGPFDFNGSPADRVIVTWSETPPDKLFKQSAMANRILGIAAVLSRTEVRPLTTLSRNAQMVGWPNETEVIGVVHVSLGNESKTFRVGVTPDQLALFADIESTEVYALPAESCNAVVHPLLRYAGNFSKEPVLPRAEVIILPGPYQHAPILLDTQTIRDRLAGGRKSQLPETARFLPEEQFLIRLPKGSTPREPAGLLVWVNAGSSGSPPAVFNDAADAMGLVMIGASDSGNVRLSTDRYQLALDAVATATRRFHIDPARVYVTGISGGGRISSALLACFPDIFTGAVPIVGLNTYKPVPLGDGRFVASGYGKPKPARWRLFRNRRTAAVSGPLDFNYREMVNAVRILQRDGLDARLFEYDDMAHTLPTPERFTEAIGWVDARQAKALDKAWADAEEQLERYLAKFDNLPIQSDTQRRLLERITVTAPWSPAAWQACELLGIVEPLPEQSGATSSGAGVPPAAQP